LAYHNVDRYFIVHIKLKTLDISTIEKYDIEKMYKVYDKWPQIAKKSFELEQDSINFEDVNHIVFSGMGGSGAIGDAFSSILSKSKIHISVVKGYILPKTVDVSTLVIITSVSGNTVETISILEAAHKIGSKIIVFSSGGKIQDFCIKNNITFRFIEKIHSPRASFVNYFYSMLNVLHSTFKIKHEDILESIFELEKLSDKINSLNLTKNNSSLNLANKISGIPLIIYPSGLKSVAIRFKNSLQENGKTHVITEEILETCHNGIVSWEQKSIVQPIILQGKDDNIYTKERWKIIKKYFDDFNIEYQEISSLGGNILSKLINLNYLLDYTSIYYAVLTKIDPSTVNSINYIKKRL